MAVDLLRAAKVSSLKYEVNDLCLSIGQQPSLLKFRWSKDPKRAADAHEVTWEGSRSVIVVLDNIRSHVAPWMFTRKTKKYILSTSESGRLRHRAPSWHTWRSASYRLETLRSVGAKLTLETPPVPLLPVFLSEADFLPNYSEADFRAHVS